MPTLHTLGEILVDAVPSGTETAGPFTLPRLTLVPGGAPANVAAQVARLGGKARHLGGISSDPWGAFLRDALATMGVDTSGLVVRAEPTALAIVQLSACGDRSFRFFRNNTADLAVELAQLDLAGIRPGDAVHTCSNTLVGEPARSVTLAALREAKRRGALVSVDPNLRPMLWAGGAVDPEPVLESLAQADLVKAGLDEATALAGSPEAFARRCLAGGARAVVFSDGPNALRCHSARGTVARPTPQVVAVDTTGAGDALCGGLLYPLVTGAAGDAKATLEDILSDPGKTRAWLDFAAACGALTVTKPGAMPALPDLASVSALAAKS